MGKTKGNWVKGWVYQKTQLTASVFSIAFPRFPPFLPSSSLSPCFCNSLLSPKQQVLLVFTDGLDDELETLKEVSELLRSKGKCRALPCGALFPRQGWHSLADFQMLTPGHGTSVPLKLTRSLPLHMNWGLFRAERPQTPHSQYLLRVALSETGLTNYQPGVCFGGSQGQLLPLVEWGGLCSSRLSGSHRSLFFLN